MRALRLATTLFTLAPAPLAQIDLEILPPPPGAGTALTWMSASSASADGGVVFGWHRDTSQSAHRAFRWVEGLGTEDLGRPPGNMDRIWLRRCSRDGTIALGEFFDSTPIQGRGVVWREGGGWEVLPLPAGTVATHVVGMSDDGEAFVGLARDMNAQHVPYFWPRSGSPIQLAPTIDEFEPFWLDPTGTRVWGVSQGAVATWTSGSGVVPLSVGAPPDFAIYEVSHVSEDGTILYGMGASLTAGSAIWRSTGPGTFERYSAMIGLSPMFIDHFTASRDGQRWANTSRSLFPDPEQLFSWNPESGLRNTLELLDPLGLSPEFSDDRIFVEALADGGDSIVGMIIPTPGSIRCAFRLRCEPGRIGWTYCSPALPNASGRPARISAHGTGEVASNDLVLRAADLPTNSFAAFLVSAAPSQFSAPLGSVGLLCLSPPIGRYVAPGEIRPTGSVGEVELTLNLNTTPTPTGLLSIAAGEEWFFQCWFRDRLLGTPTSNFTDAVAIRFR